MNKNASRQFGDRTAALLDREAIAAWIFLAPALVLLGVFVFWPIAYLGALGFTSGSFTVEGARWVGLRNYARLILDPDFWQVLGNTAYFTIATLVPSLVVPLMLAVLLDRAIALRDWLRTAYFLPSIASLVAVGLGWRWLFQNRGPVNEVLLAMDIEPIPWLNSTAWAMPVLILLAIWKQLGFNLVVFLAGLQSIPQSRYEAATLDGAGEVGRFWHVTLPGLRPTLVFATITTAIFTLRNFEPVYIMTGGGPLNSTNILVYFVYEEAFARFDFGYAAAAATVLLAIAFVLVYWQLRAWGEE
ncbi:ABC-type sugar transport system, permease component [Rubidibacter lacunae KORDI 51-2]|uniref:ABC-type sugar transport system, permease component n=1 Tax=Rubidibacter lacunae KORDI 51-2 TaxID=582515 RepID=U5D9G4_9CHRO|nr:sugar ABC transporter permease [Rubidibacter lacunae]ERN41233.1 ABC-type sugar transport system, permease component [Rubidibacter lacunae KORDI 51-2]